MLHILRTMHPIQIRVKSSRKTYLLFCSFALKPADYQLVEHVISQDTADMIFDNIGTDANPATIEFMHQGYNVLRIMNEWGFRPIQINFIFIYKKFN